MPQLSEFSWFYVSIVCIILLLNLYFWINLWRSFLYSSTLYCDNLFFNYL